MTKLNTIHKRVLEILCEDPATRNSDKDLYIKYISKYYGNRFLNQPFVITFTDKNLPNYLTVGRARRKIQELYPHLKADENVSAVKEVMEGEFEEYAKRKY